MKRSTIPLILNILSLTIHLLLMRQKRGKRERGAVKDVFKVRISLLYLAMKLIRKICVEKTYLVMSISHPEIETVAAELRETNQCQPISHIFPMNLKIA